MANIKITELTELNDPDSTDVLPIVDVGADVTKKVSVGEVVGKITGDVDVATDGTSSIASGVIVNDDINASAAIEDTKLDTISTAGKVSNSATTATDANTASAIVARDASGDFSAGTITADLTGNADTATALSSSRTFAVTGDVTGTVSSDLTSGASIATSIESGVIVDDDVNAAAAIAGSKISPNFGSQTVQTTGVFSAADGAEETPSIAFTDDLDTGIYSPGDNQLAISTNGTGRLFVDANGNVGVGTANPGSPLHVQGVSGTYPTSIINHSAIDVEGEFLRVGRSDSAFRYHSIYGKHSATDSTNYLQFRIHNADSADSQSTVMTLNGKSRVGINTASPIHTLDVNGNCRIGSHTGISDAGLYVMGRNAGDDRAIHIMSVDGNGGGVIGTTGDASADNGLALSAYRGSGYFSFRTGGTASSDEKLRITSAGTLMHLGNGDSTTPAVQFNGSAPANSMVMLSDGKVGLGTSGPGQVVDVNNSVDFNTARFRTTGLKVNQVILDTGHTNYADARANSLEWHTSGTFKAGIGMASTGTYGDSLAFVVGGAMGNTPEVVLTPSGNVGIGTANPGTQLEIAGSASTLLRLDSSNGNGGVIRIRNSGVDTHFFGSSADFLTGGAAGETAIRSNSAILFGISSNEKARIDSSGRLLVGTSTSVGPDNFLQLVGDVNDEASITCWRSSDNTGSGNLNFIKTRGSVASPSAASNDDTLGIIRWHAHDGSTWDGRAAQIEAFVDGGVSPGDTPGRLVFSTNGGAPDTSPTPRMTIDNAGTTTITSAAATAPFVANISTSEAARIDSDGRLLVGTTTATGNATTEIKGGTLSTTAATNKGGMLRVQSGAGNMSTASSITISDYFTIEPRRVVGVVYATTVGTSGHRTRSWKVYGKIGALSIVDDVNDSSSGGGSTPNLVLTESTSGVLTITPSWAFGGLGYVWSVDLLVGCAAS